MTRKRIAWILAFAVLSAGLLGTALAAGAATNVRIYKDPAGDGKGGPDIRSLRIGDTGGVIELAYNVVGLKAPAAGKANPFVATWVDTTGDGTAEYLLDIEKTQTGTAWCVITPTSRCVKSSKMHFSTSGNIYTLKLASSDLGGATAFDFWVKSGTVTDDGKMTVLDSLAKDGSYTLKSVKLLLGSPTVAPSRPVAGKLVTITVPIARSDGARLPSGKGTRVVANPPTIDGTVIIPDNFQIQLENGTLSVSFTVPASATGKLVKMSVSAMSGQMGLGVPGISTFNLDASRSFSFRVA
jgi:hypothetical protein